MPSSPHHTLDNAVVEKESSKPRRFAPEPIETTTKSSKQSRRQADDHVQTTQVRRFAPEPIETSSKSTRDKHATQVESKPAPRRFAPQPVEMTHRSSKDKSEENTGHVRFKPQLVETTVSGNRRSSSRKSSQDGDDASTLASDNGVPRKFVPVVLSTAKRSRRKGDSNEANYRNYKTEEGFVTCS
jgi:hypothetical protein